MLKRVYEIPNFEGRSKLQDRVYRDEEMGKTLSKIHLHCKFHFKVTDCFV